MTADVFVTKSASYLPLPPVDNDSMEQVLGMIGGKPSRARAMVLRRNGIVNRHYAIDRHTGLPTMSNAQMTAQAIRNLGVIDTHAIGCLATGTSMPDQTVPNHAVMVHGELGWPHLEAVACAGVCLAGIASLKYAWMAVRSGEVQQAIATGSELASPQLLAHYFNPELEHKLQELGKRPEIAFEKDFLRWMLSDGAGAVLLSNTPSAPLSLRVDWIELSSAAHELPACMFAGATQNADNSLQSWRTTSPELWMKESIFVLKQNVRLLNEHIVRATLAEPLSKIIRKRNLKAADINWFLPHMSSCYFSEPIAQCLQDIGLPIPHQHWFTNLVDKGNTGSASPFIMLDELFRSGRIQKGHRLLMFIPESGRFSSGFIHLQAV